MKEAQLRNWTDYEGSEGKSKFRAKVSVGLERDEAGIHRPTFLC